MLSVKIQSCAPGIVAFPIHLYKYVVISGLQLNSHHGIMIAVENIVDILAHLFGDFLYF